MRTVRMDVRSWKWEHLILAFRLAWLKARGGHVGYYRMCRLEEVEAGIFKETVSGTPTLLLMSERQECVEVFNKPLDLDEAYRFSLSWIGSLEDWRRLSVYQRGWRIFSGNKTEIAGYEVVLGFQIHIVESGA